MPAFSLKTMVKLHRERMPSRDSSHPTSVTSHSTGPATPRGGPVVAHPVTAIPTTSRPTRKAIGLMAVPSFAERT